MELSIWDTCYRKHNSTTNVDIRICRHSKPCMNMIKKIREGDWLFIIFHFYKQSCQQISLDRAFTLKNVTKLYHGKSSKC